MLLFILMGVISTALTSIVIYETKRVQTLSYQEMCHLSKTSDYINFGGDSLERPWNGAQNLEHLM
jgi:hypothetical protein